ncbi:hypothetical protein [Romboutsia sp. 1001216sp1]|uniref:hypothetical protein n=1 Tax=Romboutsia sp. 1001216sp1 TaxID=2986997 RepID=UPI00232FD7D5|nr:hypothetical protein [Romboutsia sp. 1001216sp1]MDB8805000.1 hypothetical protein [Romboutsia sp. 1001216sp1]MDB8807990.1 hypothetical protein [Romboutsia sp. 1001216sp1]MDB8810645.1 hypothetical protein [Romboutsia sp. 1001216sp1]MDB8816365.1 hypothetical protein [Romboutsia sp. 1001216sp1]MDB8818682.1 hypothetical protein [Romboutsia sp. 1001216sp1]
MDVKKKLKEYYGDMALFYIKFTRKKQWAEDILDGKLFMNKIDYYRNLELNSGIKGQGDIDELKATLELAKVELINEEENITIPIDASNLKFELSDDKDKPVFCLTGFTIDDLIIDSYGENSVDLKFPYKIEDIDALKSEFGEYMVILAHSEFESKIKDAANRENINGLFGKVKYVHKNSMERLRAYQNKSADRFFYKDLEFKHQNEYRVVLDENIENTKIFDIGPIEFNMGVKKIDELFDIKITINDIK